MSSDLTLHPYHVTLLRALPATVDELDRHAKYLPELIEHGLATVALSQPGRAPIYAPTAAGARVITHSRLCDTRRVERPGPTRQPLPVARTGRWWDMREDEGDLRALRLESETGITLADVEQVLGDVEVDARTFGEPEYLAAVYEDIAAALRWMANEAECDKAGVP